MRLLLDTHIALWAIVDDARLPQVARDLILDGRNDIYVSAASIWEIAIKHALARGGPNDMTVSGGDALHYFRQSGYEMIAISADHAAAVADLPPLHADPFDRIIVSQALSEPLALLTHDRTLGQYSDAIQVV